MLHSPSLCQKHLWNTNLVDVLIICDNVWSNRRLEKRRGVSYKLKKLLHFKVALDWWLWGVDGKVKMRQGILRICGMLWIMTENKRLSRTLGHRCKPEQIYLSLHCSNMGMSNDISCQGLCIQEARLLLLVDVRWILSIQVAFVRIMWAVWIWAGKSLTPAPKRCNEIFIYRRQDSETKNAAKKEITNIICVKTVGNNTIRPSCLIDCRFKSSLCNNVLLKITLCFFILPLAVECLFLLLATVAPCSRGKEGRPRGAIAATNSINTLVAPCKNPFPTAPCVPHRVL